MDNFELKPEPIVKRKPMIWNILTILVLVAACVLAYFFMQIFNNPNSPYNPFPPQPLPTVLLTPTPTATIILQPPTWTPTLTPQPSPTRTKAPTWTPVSELITPTDTIEPNLTPLQGTQTLNSTDMPAMADITYAASTDIHPELACKWAGVGGKVVDSTGQPVRFQTIQLGGALAGKPVNSIVISGSNTAYGAGGFEFDPLADAPVDSSQTLWIQLFDNKGTQLTQKIYFDTYANCEQNLVMVVFTLKP